MPTMMGSTAYSSMVAACALLAAVVPFANAAVAEPGTQTATQPALTATEPAAAAENWSFHAQNTITVQGYPAFSARYSGHNSLPRGGETRETVSLDLMGGFRLWPGAEAHMDALTWQGFGVANTLGAEGFPSAEAYRIGTDEPNASIVRLFVRQTFGFGGATEDVPGDQLNLAGKRDVSRLTLTLGRFAAADIFDSNTYANSARTQFMNWALVNNVGWDYPADTIGYTSGFVAELNQPDWTLRYGIFEVPGVQNGMDFEDSFVTWPFSRAHEGPAHAGAFGMALEVERRYEIESHPGAIRFLAYLNKAAMANYNAATAVLQANGPTANISPNAYHYKYGFGVNLEQEIARGVGIFSRLGWNDGRTQSWMFNDVDYAFSLGLSVKGQAWNRPNDTFGLAGAANGISNIEQHFFQAGGTGILAGDGNLKYGWEKVGETYYDFQIVDNAHLALDYQFISDPAFNRARGPVSFFAIRFHWEM